PAWPDFAGITKDDNGLDREARRMMQTLQRCAPCEGAGVACYTGSTVTHVGIVVCMGGLLYVAECNPKSHVSIIPLARFMRRFVKVEFWQ
ncbi:nitrite transporter, partial [Escherichia coli]|nr:nitrite transporter [Escherichia coli]